MSNINFNNIFEREQIANDIKNILLSFDDNCKNLNFKKGIYIYGSPGTGKTQFVMNLLKEMNYDIIKYDAGDVRNKSLIDTITTNNVSNRNVLDMMKRQVKKIAIVMDEIDGMNNGDKGGITALIKIIRQKKTKKQRLENMTMNPIICIGNYYIDKKIKELMKVCNTFELKTPTYQQMNKLLIQTIPIIKKKIDYKDILLKYTVQIQHFLDTLLFK
jgi:replication factor C subunit 1